MHLYIWKKKKNLHHSIHLAITTLWADSADDKLMIFLFFPENKFWHFLQIVSWGNNLHEISKPIFLEKWEKYFKMSSTEIITQHAKC